MKVNAFYFDHRFWVLHIGWFDSFDTQLMVGFDGCAEVVPRLPEVTGSQQSKL